MQQCFHCNMIFPDVTLFSIEPDNQGMSEDGFEYDVTS